ncbi:hypothetical protein ASZ90_019471 [hydrocarbon metagenome]|uniref:PRTRC system protein B n=1 Tax=hydrocarbon metagenome TaxID=938273 RepID=A0A0W8E3F8_9ZZZZ
MIHLIIQENGAFIELEDNGKKEFREINIHHLIDSFNSAVRDVADRETFETPLLPVGTIKHIQDANDPKRYSLFLFKEPTIGPIIYESRDYIVGYPALIYRFKVENQFLSQVKIWAVQDKNLTPDTPVYNYPYFNAWQDGKICMGSNRIPIEEPWQLFKVPDILKVMPSNLGLKPHNNSGLEGDSLLKAAEGKPFPNEWLKPSQKQLINILSTI